MRSNKRLTNFGRIESDDILTFIIVILRLKSKILQLYM